METSGALLGDFYHGDDDTKRGITLSSADIVQGSVAGQGDFYGGPQDCTKGTAARRPQAAIPPEQQRLIFAGTSFFSLSFVVAKSSFDAAKLQFHAIL